MPVICAFVSHCLVAIPTMEIALLLYGLLVIFSSCCISGWSILYSLGADWREITILHSSVTVLCQSVSVET